MEQPMGPDPREPLTTYFIVVMVLGVPDPGVAQVLRLLRQRDAAGEGLARGPAGGDEGQVEDREDHGHGPLDAPG